MRAARTIGTVFWHAVIASKSLRYCFIFIEDVVDVGLLEGEAESEQVKAMEEKAARVRELRNLF